MFLESPKQETATFFHVFSWAVHLPVEDQNEEHRLHCESLSWKRPNKGSLEGMHPGQSSSLPEGAVGKGVAVSGSLLAWPKASTDQVSQQALPKEAPGQCSPTHQGLVTDVSNAHTNSCWSESSKPPWHWFVYIESTWILGQAAFRKGVPKSAALDKYEFSLFCFLLFLPLFIWNNFTRNLASKDWKTGLAWLRSKSTCVKICETS